MEHERDFSPMERAGATTQCGSEGGSMTLPYASEEATACTRGFLDLCTLEPLVDVTIAETLKASALAGVRQTMDDANAVAMHECTNTFLRSAAEQYTFRECSEHIRGLGLRSMNAALETYFGCPDVDIISPTEATPAPRVQVAERTWPDIELSQQRKKAVPATSRHIPMDRAQTVVVMARPGTCDTSDAHRFMVVNDLLYHICFHSLGSRMYKIRERTGIFYGANAQFNVGADTEGAGFDYVMTRVEPTDVARVRGEFGKLFAQMQTAPAIEARELAAACRWYENRWVQCMNDVTATCDSMRTLSRLYPTEDGKTLPQRLIHAANATTVESINAICKKVFSQPWTFELTVGQ
jgi:hypothetical protein